MNTCPGGCRDAEKIEHLQKRFPALELNELTTKMKEIGVIRERLEKFRKKMKIRFD
jgi:hypothetical protein